VTIYNLRASLSPVLIVRAGDGPSLIINRDHSNSVLLGNIRSIGTAQSQDVTQLDPLATIGVNGNLDVWAVALTNTATVNVQKDAYQWTPTPSELVVPLFASGVTALPAFGSITNGATAIDVRAFTSYYLRVLPAVTSGPTVQNSVQVVLGWCLNPDKTGVLYADAYEFWSPQVAGGTGVDTSTFSSLRVSDIMHGPYMFFEFDSLGGDNQTIDAIVSGTTRDIPNPMARQDNSALFGDDGQLANKDTIAIANGATARVPALFGYGHVHQRFDCGAGGVNIKVTFGFNPWNFDNYTLGANGFSVDDVVYPKRSALYTVTNASGIASTYTIRSFNEFQRV
jgi:hypothetical protein